MTRRRPAAPARLKAPTCALFLSLLLALLAETPAVQADEAKINGLRQDAILLLRSFWNTTGFLMVCPRYVGENPPYLQAAEAWKHRHNPYLARITEVIEGSGGMSREDKARIAQEGFEQAEAQLLQRGDSGLYCFQLAEELEGGTFDFDRQEEIAPALGRLMKTNGH